MTKDDLIYALKGNLSVVGIVVMVSITSWITGQPLSWLSKLAGISHMFVRSTVPAWKFALTLFTTVILGSVLARELRRRPQTLKVHYVPDHFNSGWSIVSGDDLQVRLAGTFTYEGPSGRVKILRVSLAGAIQVSLEVILNPGPGTRRPETLNALELDASIPQEAILYVGLKPQIGTQGKILEQEVTLQDHLKRHFSLGTVALQYLSD